MRALEEIEGFVMQQDRSHGKKRKTDIFPRLLSPKFKLITI